MLHFITGVAFSQDGRRLAVSRWRDPIEVYDVASKTSGARIVSSDSPVQGLVFSHDGARIFSVALKSGLQAWDVSSGKHLWSGEHERAKAISLSGDGSRIATGGYDGIVRVWKASSGELEYEYAGHEDYVYGVDFSADGRTVASCGTDGTVRLWEVDSDFAPTVVSLRWEAPKRPEGGLEQPFDPRAPRHPVGPVIESVALSPMGDIVVCGGLEVLVHAVADGRKLGTMETRLERSSGSSSDADVEMTPDGALLVWSNGAELLRVSDVATGRQLACRDACGQIDAIALSPDGRTVACGMTDSSVVLWDLRAALGRGQEARALAGLWDAMASEDAGEAYVAMLEMAEGGDGAVDLLLARLLPPPTASSDPAREIADLDSDDAEVRSRASLALEARGAAVVEDLRKALATDPSPEQRRRIEEVLSAIDLPSIGMSSELRRRLRAIVVLGWISTDAAADGLRRLAKEASGREAAWPAATSATDEPGAHRPLAFLASLAVGERLRCGGPIRFHRQGARDAKATRA